MAHRDPSVLKPGSHLPSWPANPGDLPPFLWPRGPWLAAPCRGLWLCSAETEMTHSKGGRGAGAARVGSGIPRRLKAAVPGPSLPPTGARAPSTTTLASVTGRAGRCQGKCGASSHSASSDRLGPQWPGDPVKDSHCGFSLDPSSTLGLPPTAAPQLTSGLPQFRGFCLRDQVPPRDPLHPVPR